MLLEAYVEHSQSWQISTVEAWQHQVGISNGNSLRSTPLCFFFGIVVATPEAKEGRLRGLHRQTYADATLWSSPTRRLCHPPAQTAHAEGVLSKNMLLKMDT